MFKIYIMNLGKYNEGKIAGQWLTLPTTEGSIKEAFNNIGLNDLYEEYIIADSINDFNFNIGEYASVHELNKVAQYLESFDEYELKLINALLEGDYISYNDLMNEDVDLYNYSYVELEENTFLCDEANLGYALIEQLGFEGINNMEYYFDMDKFANDLYYDFDLIVEDMDEEEKEYMEDMTRSEFAEWYIEGIGSVEDLGKQTLENYFNYESFGRDVILEGAFVSSNGIAIL